MCPPVMAAMPMIISAISAVGSIALAVDAQKTGTEQALQQQQAAADAYILETHQANKRITEENKAAAQKKGDNNLKARRAGASAVTAAGSTSGLSVQNVLGDFRRSEGIVNDRIDQNNEAVTDQIDFDMRGLQAKAQNRINQSTPPGMGEVYGVALRGAGSFYNEVQDYRDA